MPYNRFAVTHLDNQQDPNYCHWLNYHVNSKSQNSDSNNSNSKPLKWREIDWKSKREEVLRNKKEFYDRIREESKNPSLRDTQGSTSSRSSRVSFGGTIRDNTTFTFVDKEEDSFLEGLEKGGLGASSSPVSSPLSTGSSGSGSKGSPLDNNTKRSSPLSSPKSSSNVPIPNLKTSPPNSKVSSTSSSSSPPKASSPPTLLKEGRHRAPAPDTKPNNTLKKMNFQQLIEEFKKTYPKVPQLHYLSKHFYLYSQYSAVEILLRNVYNNLTPTL